MATVDVQPAAAATKADTAAEKTSQDVNHVNGKKSEESTSKADEQSTVEQSTTKGDQNKSEEKSKEHPPSERVQAARLYNSRDRTFGNRRKTKDTDYKKNIKSDFSSQKETDDPVQIRKQVFPHILQCPSSPNSFMVNDLHVGGVLLFRLQSPHRRLSLQARGWTYQQTRSIINHSFFQTHASLSALFRRRLCSQGFLDPQPD